MQTIVSKVKESCTVSDPADDICPVCDGTGWEEIEVPEPMYGEGATVKKARPCRACNSYHLKQVSNAKKVSSIPKDRSIADFDWTLYGVELNRQRAIVQKFLDRFSEFEREGLGLFIASRTRGSGKTYLAGAIGGELINRYAVSTRFVSASDLIEISKQKPEDGSDPLDELVSCRLLILDDLGQKLTGRDWLTDVLYRVIDKRYQLGKVMIVTSNVMLPELDFDDRIVDRLNSMTVTIKLPEYCVRAREANTRKKAILQKLGID